MLIRAILSVGMQMANGMDLYCKPRYISQDLIFACTAAQRQAYLDEGMSDKPVVVVWQSREAVVEAVLHVCPVFSGRRKSPVSFTGH